jgi:hypothetical protein
MIPRSKRVLVGLGLASLGIVAIGCGGTQHLSEYDFTGHRLAVESYAPYGPDLWTGGVDLRAEDAVSAVLDAGSRAAKEIEGRRARSRLDSAASHVDVSKRMASTLLERSSRYLGATPVQDADSADYVLELDVRQLAIDARRTQARLYMEGTVSLLDRTTGREIWHTKVTARDPLTPNVRRGDDIPGDVVTAGALYTLSVSDFEGMLQDMADLSSRAVLDHLRSDLREVREDRRP